MSICLDSWAILAWLDGDEPAAEAVHQAFLNDRPWMSWINLGEVAYQLERRQGYRQTLAVLKILRPILALDDISPERVLQAARIKAEHPIAYADCFAAATAVARRAILLTGDPELIDRDLGCEVRDLRSS